MKTVLILALFTASAAFANQFSNFVGTYIPVSKSVDQSFGRADCATYGFSQMTEFKIYASADQLAYSKKGPMDSSAGLVPYSHKGPRFQKEVYISGQPDEATRQETVFDFLHNEYSSSAITISKLTNGNYSLKYVSHFTNEMDNLHAACSSEVEVARK